MIRIKQDTDKVHLLGDDDRAICGAEHTGRTLELATWQAGFTPAAIGTRVCRDCEAEAGTAAKFEPGEKDEGTTWKPLDG
jgi:hypothetical protein